MTGEKDKQQDKSVLDDKEKFGKKQGDDKLSHMGDKPKQPSEKGKAGKAKEG